MPRFTTLMKDASWPKYGGTLISNKQNNGEFDFYFVIELIDWEDATGDCTHGKWNVSLYSVSPAEAGQDNLARAFSASGIQDVDLQSNPIVQVEVLASYGIKAVIWNDNGNNYKQLLAEARKQAKIASSLYGFYMDRSQNLIGTSGWDAQRGNILAGLNKG